MTTIEKKAAQTLKKNLSELRAQIDDIDSTLLALIEQRLAVAAEVGKLKDQLISNQNYIRPAREATVIKNVIQRSTNILDPSTVIAVWRGIISQAVNNEQSQMILAQAAPGGLFRRIAQPYFPCMACQEKENATEIMEDLVQKKATMAVLPIHKNDPWWITLPSTVNIFMQLSATTVSEPPVVALAQIPLEPSGDDATICCFLNHGDSQTFLKRVRTVVAGSDLVCQHGDHYAVRLPGFFSVQDLKQLFEDVARTQITLVRRLGTYTILAEQ